MVNSQWSTGNGQWSMVNGQRSTVNSQQVIRFSGWRKEEVEQVKTSFVIVALLCAVSTPYIIYRSVLML